jgi:hypothetical protein
MSHLSVQTKLETVSSDLHHYAQNQVQLLSLLSINKCINCLPMAFKQRLYSDIFLFIFIGAAYITKFSI